jgi:hypothetical protein
VTKKQTIAVARLRGSKSTIVVVGTSDIHAACAAAGISPHTHSWSSTGWDTEGWVLHRDGTASHVYQRLNETRGRAAVVFFGPIVKREATR